MRPVKRSANYTPESTVPKRMYNSNDLTSDLSTTSQDYERKPDIRLFPSFPIRQLEPQANRPVFAPGKRTANHIPESMTSKRMCFSNDLPLNASEFRQDYDQKPDISLLSSFPGQPLNQPMRVPAWRFFDQRPLPKFVPKPLHRRKNRRPSKAPKKRRPKFKRALPPNATERHPCDLLNYVSCYHMSGVITLIYRSKHSFQMCPPFKFTQLKTTMTQYSLTVNGKVYLGEGRSKKLARRSAAMAACEELFGVQFDRSTVN